MARRSQPMSVPELKALARKHWTEFLPRKVAELRAQGTLDEELQGAATLAQTEIEQLKSRGYQESEAREVALPKFILLTPEPVEDEQARELAAKEAEYQKHPPVPTDPEENLPVR